MNGWLHYLELQAKSRTGLSSRVVVCATVAAVCGAVAFGFLLFAVFIWLAESYSPLTAALILGAVFLLLAIVALICCLIAQNQTAERAKRELAVRSSMSWLDPKYLGIGLQVGRAIGWRKLVPLVAVGLLAAGLAKEWFSQAKPDGAEGDGDDGA